MPRNPEAVRTAYFALAARYPDVDDYLRVTATRWLADLDALIAAAASAHLPTSTLAKLVTERIRLLARYNPRNRQGTALTDLLHRRQRLIANVNQRRDIGLPSAPSRDPDLTVAA